MWESMRPSTLVPVIAAAVLLAGAMVAGAAPGDQVTVPDSTIVVVNGSNVTIAFPDGSQKVAKIQPDTLILSRETATLGAIKPGDALAVTAKRGADGSLTAVSISILSPELWSRAPKGQWVMESGDTMTNAVVAQTVERVEGRTLYMKLDVGIGALNVPTATEIHRVTPVRLGDLKPGIRVRVRGVADPDGTIKASSITFDRPGYYR
jgi:predicted thioesterase